MRRIRLQSKAPVAIAGVLAAPLFFVGLMAFSLKLDTPSHTLTKRGAVVLADPTKSSLGTIYLLALVVALGVVVVGLLASLLRSRLAAVLPSAAAILASILLLLPLGTWAAEHAARYPLGVDNIPSHSPQDLSLRGEWEQSAQTAANQIGLATIALAAAAILLTVFFEIRRRRGAAELLLAPTGVDVEMGSGGAPQITGGG